MKAKQLLVASTRPPWEKSTTSLSLAVSPPSILVHLTEYVAKTFTGGPSGALLASRLASSRAAPSVLLVEAGREADDLATRSLTTRYISWAVKPDLNWGYKTVPQKYAKNRILDQPRGKALGGSTNNNFCVWTTPPKGDLEEWATRMNDELFGWPNGRTLLNEIEAYELDCSPSDTSRFDKYVRVSKAAHRTTGKVTAEYSTIVDKGFSNLLDAMTAYGWPANLDMNSGEPIGHGLIPSAADNLRYRLTASAAYLAQPPSNLEIRSLTQVAKILFQGVRAVGIETVQGDSKSGI